MKKILYIGGFELPDKNAAAQRVMANAKLLRTMGYEVSFIGVTKSSIESDCIYDGFVCKMIEYPSKTRDWLRYVTVFVSGEIILQYKPDFVLLYNFPAVASLRILRLCHRKGIKVIQDVTEWEQTDGYSIRDMIKRVDTAMRMRFCNKRMDGVIAISRYLYDFYNEKVKTILVPPTVDLEDKKWEISGLKGTIDRVALVYAGSITSKSKDRLDQIVGSVSKFEDIELVIVGMTREQYENVFGPFPTSCTNVTFMGRCSHQETVKIIQESDFQVLIRDGSRKNTAGFPTKFVESISCGTPVIATLSSNIEDYLHDGENGFIVDDSHPLDDVLKTVSSLSKDDKEKMKRYCRRNNPFDYHNYRKEFVRLFPVD